MLQFYLAALDSEDDKRKFESIYIRYRNLMYLICNRILHDDHLSEDAVHQAFLRILKNLDKIKVIDSLQSKNFVSLIAKNCAIDEYNKRKTRSTVPFEDVEAVLYGEDRYQSDYDDLTMAIRQLPTIYKDVLMLKYYQDFTLRQIASVLKIKENTVKQRLSRARQMLELEIERGATDDIHDNRNKVASRHE